MAKRSSGGRGNSSLSNLSVADLQAELSRRGRRVKALERRYFKLHAKLESLRGEIESIGGTVTAGGVVVTGRKRAQNDTNLVEALAKVLKGRTLSVTELTDAVQKAGYKTTSRTFRTIVNQALIKHTDRFKKVSRGMYTAS